MSKIMRQLETEGRAARKAREAAAAPTAPPAPPPAEPIYFELDPAGPCFHGIALNQACYACGRFSDALYEAQP